MKKKVDVLHMCTSFFGFALASAVVGIAFFILNILTGTSVLRESISFFFLVLSILILAIYVKHGSG